MEKDLKITEKSLGYEELVYFITRIESSKNILILTHTSPDGDAIGSSIGLKLFLEKLGKKVDICVEDIPRSFSFLPNVKDIKEYNEFKNTLDKYMEDNNSFWYDTCICIDLNNTGRIDKRVEFFENIQNTIVIDHHVKQDKFCDISIIVENETSASQIVFNIIEYYENIVFNNEKSILDKDIMLALITGIITDTGGFRFDTTNDKTFEIAKIARNMQISFNDIITNSLLKTSKNEIELRKQALINQKYYLEDKLTITYLTKESKEYINSLPGETEAIVGMLRNIDDVEVAVFLKEISENEFKISFRSGKLDLIPIVTKLNGGGHKNAAGGYYSGNLNDGITTIIGYVKEQLIKEKYINE